MLNYYRAFSYLSCFFHALPSQVYFDLSIADNNVLTKCKWCAAGDPAGCSIFSNDLEGIKQKAKHQMN